MLDIINDVRKSGTLLRKAAIMVDVSGSMSSGGRDAEAAPLHVAIALGLIVSEVSETHRVLTFSEHPEWVNLAPCTNFTEKVRKIQNSQWSMNTDFYAAVERLTDGLTDAEQLPSALFVLSDMQFD
jgi:hypothetical protein